MARKQYPYNAMTTKKFREMGRYYWKAEHLNPFHIIKERDNLRDFRDSVLKFCNLARECENIETIKGYIDLLLDKTVATRNNSYFAGEKQDAFGFIDYLCIDATEGIVAVQVTSKSGASEHRKKILRNVYAQRWVNFDKIELWTWRKLLVKKGGKLRTWQPNVEVITPKMFVEFAKSERSKENERLATSNIKIY